MCVGVCIHTNFAYFACICLSCSFLSVVHLVSPLLTKFYLVICCFPQMILKRANMVHLVSLCSNIQTFMLISFENRSK
jgi:hypothetical protein